LCAPDLGAAAIAHAIDAVLLSEDLRKSRAQIGWAHIANSHLLGAATKTLWDHIRPQIHPA
ncbi:MAG: hypothetical protein KAT26_09185, partial [Marinosulfonomonas sp.]|nr:hypothetical protein [Marinosulfonomonas sp.]